MTCASHSYETTEIYISAQIFNEPDLMESIGKKRDKRLELVSDKRDDS